MERDISNTFIKEQVTSILLAKLIYETSLTSIDFTMWRAPSARARGDQPSVTGWGCHRARAPCGNKHTAQVTESYTPRAHVHRGIR